MPKARTPSHHPPPSRAGPAMPLTSASPTFPGAPGSPAPSHGSLHSLLLLVRKKRGRKRPSWRAGAAGRLSRDLAKEQSWSLR